MKKKRVYLYLPVILCIIFFSVSGSEIHKNNKLSSQPTIEWEKTYGSNKVDWGRCVQQTLDGGYIVSGAYDRYVYTPWQGYIYLLKTDYLGVEEWSKLHGIPSYENVGQYIKQTIDGGYIIAGFTGYTYHIDAYVLKTDSSGNVIWSNILGDFDYYDNSMCVEQTNDYGFVITGWTASSGSGSSDMWLFKLDSDGVEQWSKTFGGVGLDGGQFVQQTSDGGFILIGETHSFDSGGNGDIWLVKTDLNGNEIWNTSFGGVYLDSGKCVQQTSDGGYILTGSTSSYGIGNSDVWLIKTDSNGNEIWNSTFGGTNWDEGKSVVQTVDGGYFITGDYTDMDPAHEDLELYMIKTDENGIEEWNFIIDHNGLTDSGSYGIQTSDGGYLVTGETGEYMLADIDVLLIKLTGTNLPPYIPSNPYPENQSIDIDIHTDLSWSGGDPDGDIVKYDLYFGTEQNPPLIAEDLDVESFDIEGLNCNTTYYWKIIAKDIYNAFSEGPLWSFKTVEYSSDLSFEIKGGIGVNLEITNSGNVLAEDIDWEIIIKGGFFGFINESSFGIVNVPPDDSILVSSGFLLGLGDIDIKAKVSGESKNVSGTQLIFFTLVNN